VSVSRRTALLYGVAACALLLDRLSKAWVESSLAGRPPIRVIPGVLSLNYTTNSGGAFGLGRSAPWVFAGATIIVSLVIIWVSFRPMRTSVAIALGLILGGAIGNVTDRIANGPGLRGEVTDFIDFHVWPVFNLADSAIVLGAIVLAFSSYGEQRGREESRSADGPLTAAPDEPTT
jgi:signal peptidase II